MVLEPWKYILAGLVATLGSFDHFQLPSCEGNNKCQSLKAKRKPSWHWIVPIVIILSPPHSKMNFVHVFVTNNKRYSIDMNVAQYHLVHLNCGIWKLCLWNSKSRRNYIICCTVEKRRLSKIILFMESNYFPGFPFEGYLSHSGYCHRSCLLSSVIC